MMRSIILFLVLASVGFSACETTNPFNQGPAYDFEGNLATDRKKIAAYLDTAKIDSVYRIHDPSGVVVIVQEEGKGSRPTNNTVVYTDYIGKLMTTGDSNDSGLPPRQRSLFLRLMATATRKTTTKSQRIRS